MKHVLLLMVAGMMLAGGVAHAGSAKLVRARVVPYSGGNGRAKQEVLIDWKNAGKTPITEVHASIAPYDAQGNLLGSGAPSYVVFYAGDEGPLVKPGKVHHEKEGEGFKLLSFYDKAARVKVVILDAE